MTLYKIERVRTHKGQEKPEEAELKGAEVVVEGVTLSQPLVIRFTDRTLITSNVQAYNADYVKDGMLCVQTMNTTYTFRKARS